MTYTHLQTELTERILVVTINRPTVLNAMNHEVIAELQACFDSYRTDANLAAVILTGGGEKAFVAGADISEINKLTAQSGDEFSRRGLHLMRTIESFPVPVIAAINGFALGGGSELALACDIRLASNKAKIGQPEVNLGIMAGYGGTQRLARLVGRSKAMQILCTGEMLSAEEAWRIGWVDEVYESVELMPKAMAMAKTIASRGPLAVRMTKVCVDRALDLSLEAGCELERAHFALACSTDDKQEGTSAFLKKRPAKFTGK